MPRKEIDFAGVRKQSEKQEIGAKPSGRIDGEEIEYQKPSTGGYAADEIGSVIAAGILSAPNAPARHKRLHEHERGGSKGNWAAADGSRSYT